MTSDHVAQGFIQSGPEILQGPRLHNLSQQPEPLPDCPNGKFSPFYPCVNLWPLSLCCAPPSLSLLKGAGYLLSSPRSCPFSRPNKPWSPSVPSDLCASPWPSFSGLVLCDCPRSCPGARTGCHILGEVS